MNAVVAVTVEPLTPADFPIVARWLSEPAIHRWLTAEWRERSATATTIAIAARSRRNRLYLFRHRQEPCGLVALSDLDPVEGTANLWYFLGEPRHAAHGLTTAAVRELITIAFSELGLRSLQAWALKPNVPSIRLLDKVGFHFAGCLRQSSTLDGQPTDRFLFDLLASEWPAP